LESNDVKAIYRSKVEPRLVVVDKENAGKADALNCGINLARYRYVCCVDSDSFFERKSLLHAMRMILKDPGRVIGLTSLVGISGRPEMRHLAEHGEKTSDPSPFVNFQHLDYARSFLNNRIAWSRWKFMLCTIGVFAVWRRDVILELGGFAKDFTCEDIEITFRAHHRFRREKRPYEILCMPEAVAVTEGPDRISDLITQRSRWQRVILETIWHYKAMLANPRYGSVGLVGMPYYLLYEGLVPFVEFVSILSFPLAWWLGVLSWLEFLCLAGAISLANGILTNLSILFEDRRSRSYTFRSLLVFMFLGPLEYLVYRPIIFVARWKGVWGFIRGDKKWHKFKRNVRSSAAEY
jgi:cellulose synthase/poly-beta-1,6-N-acetylglucosamine synthase-like glycosyltransferase